MKKGVTAASPSPGHTRRMKPCVFESAVKALGGTPSLIDRLVRHWQRPVAAVAILCLAGCSGQPPRTGSPVSTPPSTATPVSPGLSAPPGKGGGYYLNDGPIDHNIDLAAIPDAVPRAEPLHRFANRPYSVLGRDYVPLTTLAPFRQSGVASWYGRRYHGQKTSSGEAYDMFGMTAAHPTLPIPSYVRVTRAQEPGRSVVVRINDRGPFLHERIVDLSYAAAWKLGIIESGSGAVILETVFPGQATTIAAPAPASEPGIPGATPVSASSSAPAVVVLGDIEERGSHYLQLGAFGNRDNAEALKARLEQSLGGLGSKLIIRSTGNLHRLQLGPWADGVAARRVAEELKLAFDLPTVLVR